MKNGVKVFFGFLGIVVVLLVLDLGFGWFGVFKTKTVGKAQQNADRQVFEQTQSYVEGKRQELTKDYHEWLNAKPEDRLAIEAVIRSSFANFNEEKYLTGDLYSFLHKIKNK
jgi:protein involved in ribonucleotide reduction